MSYGWAKDSEAFAREQYDPVVIREGLCPYGHGPLTRRDDCGWCETCGAGMSIVQGSVRLHMDSTFTGHVAVTDPAD